MWPQEGEKHGVSGSLSGRSDEGGVAFCFHLTILCGVGSTMCNVAGVYLGYKAPRIPSGRAPIGSDMSVGCCVVMVKMCGT
jgi:hypothetical protein